MKKITLIVASALMLTASSFAQDFLGYINSNYSGVTGTDLNPANVVDSRYKTDICLTGASFALYNNYVGMDKSALKKDKDDGHYYAFDDTLFREKYLTTRDNNINKSLYFSNQIYGPSFLVSINRKNAFAVKTKLRTLINIDGLEPELAKLAYSELQDSSLWRQKHSNQNFSAQTMTWAEYAICYGHVFKDDGAHAFKAGITAKYIQGIQSAYMNIKDLDYNFTNDTTLSLFQSDVNYGHSSTYEGDKIELGYKNASLFSWGLDLGVVYEFRPDFETFKYDMDGETGLWRRDQNK
ncbi:MAG TPA: DUF5723 family protein, partial [Bacteroidia bacterium]|nr:DUF5723 family protein [Bacteroidia bacterium]